MRDGLAKYIKNTTAEERKHAYQKGYVKKLKKALDSANEGEIRVFDVLNGGNYVDAHDGNKFFKDLVKKKKVDYKAQNRLGKDYIIEEIIKAIKSRGGRFIEQDKETKRWEEVTHSQVTKKIERLLRRTSKEVKK